MKDELVNAPANIVGAEVTRPVSFCDFRFAICDFESQAACNHNVAGKFPARLLLLALLLLLAAPSLHAQFRMGLYKDGQLIDTLRTVAQPLQTPAQQLSGTKLGPAAAAQNLAAPVISAETQARNQAFADSANAAIRIQEALRHMNAARLAAADSPQSPPLATLLEQFLALQEPVRAAYAAVGNRVLELGLPPEIYQRHLDTVAAFEAGLVQFTNAVNDVLLGKPGALENALALMDQFKFRHEPDLTKAGPTRVSMQILHAPALTREQADEMRQASAGDTEAKTSLAKAGLAAIGVSKAATIIHWENRLLQGRCNFQADRCTRWLHGQMLLFG